MNDRATSRAASPPAAEDKEIRERALATIREGSARMASVFSGVLAGVANAIRDQSEAKSGT